MRWKRPHSIHARTSFKHIHAQRIAYHIAGAFVLEDLHVKSKNSHIKTIVGAQYR